MRANALRLWLIGILVVAATLSVVAKKVDSPALGWFDTAVFVVGVAVYIRWRRTVLRERRGRVFDQEAKTDEARSRPDR
jgi:hypothetical protein